MAETVSGMRIGDQGEALVPMNLRAEIDLESEIIGALPKQALGAGDGAAPEVPAPDMCAAHDGALLSTG